MAKYGEIDFKKIYGKITDKLHIISIKSTTPLIEKNR